MIYLQVISLLIDLKCCHVYPNISYLQYDKNLARYNPGDALSRGRGGQTETLFSTPEIQAI